MKKSVQLLLEALALSFRSAWLIMRAWMPTCIQRNPTTGKGYQRQLEMRLVRRLARHAGPDAHLHPKHTEKRVS